MNAHNPHEPSPDDGLAIRRGNGNSFAAATSRGQALAFDKFPDDTAEQDRLNAISQTSDDIANVYCWRRRRRCSNPDCSDPITLSPHRFGEIKYELWSCLVCNSDRHLIPPDLSYPGLGNSTTARYNQREAKTKRETIGVFYTSCERICR